MSSPIGEVLAALGTCFDSLGVRWYLFGAQAAIFHGVARLTADVDVTVLPEPLSTGRLASVMEANGFRLRVTATDDFTAHPPGEAFRAVIILHPRRAPDAARGSTFHHTTPPPIARPARCPSTTAISMSRGW